MDRRWRPSGCWLWAARISADGYPIFRVCRAGRWRTVRAHRWAWEDAHGPIPAGWTLDHLCHSRSRRCVGGRSCRHRLCVRPDHLEPVTVAENLRRARSRRRVPKTLTSGRRRGAVATRASTVPQTVPVPKPSKP